MAAYREIKEVSDRTLENALSAEHSIYQIAHCASQDQAKSNVLQSVSGFQRPEKVYKENQRCTRSNREDQRVLGAETENSRPVAQMG